MITLTHISLYIPSIDRWILNDINYTIHPGDMIIVLGSNGSGKSSLVKIIDGTYKNSKGKIIFDPPSESKKIVTLTQDMHGSLFLGMTVFENSLLAELRYENVSLKIRSKSERIFFTD
ncbi:MAG: ATP-binding cassette domain-containing protein, partial [Gammaproteobacteria bacterium]